MEDYNYEEALEELRNRYKDGKVSAFIGAGFSKNVYKGYPSWDELLFDMVCELYDDEISQSYKIECAHSPKFLKRTPISEYKKEQVYRITKREGYLNIVSQYVERKGYREALETYIETHIPDLAGNIEDINSENEITLGYAGKENSSEISVCHKDFETHIKLLSGNWHSIYTTNYDRLLEIAKRIGKKHLKVITQASNLELDKDIPSIIKLHGSFSESYQAINQFEFDGSHRHRYIMTKEDYETYPKEHEAFTQLMRISLLQGTFCLFGFSGDDPNFLAWIKWVRDILVRYKNRTNDNSLKAIKIFLFDISDKAPSREKKLFYKNHNICHIPLLSEEIKSIITTKTEGNKKGVSIRALFLELFNYLDSTPRKYSSLWRSLMNQQTNKKQDFQKAKIHNRIIKLCHCQEMYIDNLYHKKTYTSEEIDLFILALQDTFYLPSFHKSITERIKVSTLRKETHKALDILKDREVTLQFPTSPIAIKEQSSNELNYEQTLRLSFTLSFSQLKRHLETWTPQKGIFIMKRAIFLSLFNPEEAKTDLQKYISEESIAQERYFGMEQLRLLDIWNRYAENYGREKNQGVEEFHQLKKYFFEINKNIEKTAPYGTPESSYSLDNPDTSRFLRAFRALQFLIELPLFTNHPDVKIISQTNWLSVFKSLFEKYPYPCLFYSVLYCDKYFLSRIGQEYAFSETLHESKKIDDILVVMLNSILDEDTPSKIRNNLMRLSNELFISVLPDIWETLFIKIWKTKIYPNYELLSEPNFECLEHFFIKGISIIRDKSTLEELAIEILANKDRNISLSTDFFYYIIGIRKLKRSQISNKLKEEISSFVQQISSIKEIALANNIKNLISQKDKNFIRGKLLKLLTNSREMQEDELLSINNWSNGDKRIKKELKKKVINHPRLWENGIKKESRGFPINPIRISILDQNMNWNKDEINIIFKKLLTSLNLIIKWYGSFPEAIKRFRNDKVLLSEMMYFLKRYKHILKNNQNYHTALNYIYKSLTSQEKKVRKERAIISDDRDLIIYGINEVWSELNTKSRMTNIIESLELIIYRIIYKKEELLLEFLNILSYALEKKGENALSFFKNKIISILDTYTNRDLFDLNLNIYEATKTFIKIAEYLRDRGLSSDGIDYWLERKDRFNFTWN